MIYGCKIYDPSILFEVCIMIIGIFISLRILIQLDGYLSESKMKYTGKLFYFVITTIVLFFIIFTPLIIKVKNNKYINNQPLQTVTYNIMNSDEKSGRLSFLQENPENGIYKNVTISTSPKLGYTFHGDNKETITYKYKVGRKSNKVYITETTINLTTQNDD